MAGERRLGNAPEGRPRFAKGVATGQKLYQECLGATAERRTLYQNSQIANNGFVTLALKLASWQGARFS